MIIPSCLQGNVRKNSIFSLPQSKACTTLLKFLHIPNHQSNRKRKTQAGRPFWNWSLWPHWACGDCGVGGDPIQSSSNPRALLFAGTAQMKANGNTSNLDREKPENKNMRNPFHELHLKIVNTKGPKQILRLFDFRFTSLSPNFGTHPHDFNSMLPFEISLPPFQRVAKKCRKQPWTTKNKQPQTDRSR